MNAIYIRNLKPENIKEGVEILKVKGTYQGGGPAEPVNEDITMDPSTVQQQATAGEGYTGLGTVTVNPYVLDSKTVDPSTSAFTVNSSVDGLSSVTLNPVTASIDANITAGNIKQGVSILGVSGTFNTDGDWILDAKATGVINSDTAGLGDTSYGLDNLFNHDPLTSVTILDTSIRGEYVMNQTFANCTSLTDISFPNLRTVNGNNAMYEMLRYCSSLRSVSFPELRTIDGYEAMYAMFKNVGSRLQSISFPKLESIRGNEAMQMLFDGNSRALSNADIVFPELRTITNSQNCFVNAFIGSPLRSLSFPKLETLDSPRAFVGCCANYCRCSSLSMPNLKYRNGSQNIFEVFAISNSNFNTLTASVEFFKTDNPNRNEYSMSYLTNVTVTVPEGYTYLNGWNNTNGTTYLNFSTGLNGGSWSDATILDILQKLGNVSDYDQVSYTVKFGNKTIQDNVDFDYTLAKNKLTDAGWTINGLTITVPSFITINSNPNLNLYREDEINFDALYSWTASVDDPSIHLSSASGSSGSGNVITVTMDAGWNSNATVTLSCSNGMITETETVHVFYSDANYTRLQYVRTSSSCPSVPLGVQIGVNDDAVFSFKARSNNGKTMLGYTPNSSNYDAHSWRIFYYSSNLYWDAGGDLQGSGRMYISTSSFGYNTNVVRTILFKRSNNDFMIKNLDTLDTYSQTRSTTFTGTPSVIGLGDVTGNTGVQDCDFYEFTVYPNGYQDGAGTPSAHYVAALDSNDVACIVDTISNIFYYPTSGALIPGPEY